MGKLTSFETFEEFCAASDDPRNPLPALDPDKVQVAACHLLGYYGRGGGYQPGAFTGALIRCWELADADNQRKLASQWPELSVAIDWVRRTGGTEALQALAERKAP